MNKSTFAWCVCMTLAVMAAIIGDSQSVSSYTAAGLVILGLKQ